MAFKILTDNELELLTDKQRIQYENELAVYNERVKFVEQLEKLENVVIKPYKPKLTNIRIINTPAETTFKAPEYAVKITKPIKKLQLEYTYKNLTAPVKAVLPQHSKINNVPINHIKQMKQVKPVLPQISKVTTSVKPFIKIELKTSPLPKNNKIYIPSTSFKKVEQIKLNLPTITKQINITSKSPLTKFIVPEKPHPILPKSAVKLSNIKAYKKPEQAVLDLQKVTLPKKTFSIRQIKISQAKLPEISHISPVAISFNKPNIKNTSLPNIPKVMIPAYKFAKIEHTSPVLPNVTKPNTVNLFFNKPKNQNISLPKIIKPVLPNISYKSLNKNIPEIDYPVITVNKIKPFKKVMVPAIQLPKINKILVPDNNDIQSLKNLFFANKETETTEGAN